MYNPQLETFIRVADIGSFNKAAEESYITPTAVIKQINLLESELGVRLFDRTHRGIVLTKAGKSLYNDTKYIIQYCQESVVRAKNAMIEESSVIRIGTSPMTPAEILVQLWPKIHELYPNIKFRLIPFTNTPENASEILKNLGKNIDIVAGMFDDTLLDLRGCKGLELLKTPICCAVSMEHRLSGKKSLKLADLYGEKLMLIHRGWSTYVDKLRDDVQKNHQKIKIVDFDFYDVEIFNQCENSDNVLMAIGNWANVHPLLKIIPVEWEYSVPFGMLYSPEPSPSVQKLLSAVQTVVNESPNRYNL